MKKILIATWIQYDNYGSLLQAYCLKEILNDLMSDKLCAKKQNVKTCLLNYCPKNTKHSKSFFNILDKLRKNTIKEISVKILNHLLQQIFSKKISLLKEKFSEFRKNELDLYPTKMISEYSSLEKLDRFDLYVAGSDQIWNPRIANKAYLLSWAPKDAIKISYAPSVCVESLSTTELKKYQTLESYQAISVREHTRAVEQIGKFIHEKITEVVDPVILYGGEKLIEKCKKNNMEKYAAIYLLDGAKKWYDFCKDFSKKRNLAIRVVPTALPDNLLSEIRLCRNVDWETGPMEFVNLIYDAEMLITDSFHGVVVALLLHKDFIVLPRKEGKSEQNNRIISLLEKIGVSDRYVDKMINMNKIKPIEWKMMDEKIDSVRMHSMDYLRKAVDLI